CFPLAAAWQFYCQCTADDGHYLALAGAEFIFARSHDADCGGQFFALESNRLNVAREIFVHFEHVLISSCRGRYFKQRMSLCDARGHRTETDRYPPMALARGVCAARRRLRAACALRGLRAGAVCCSRRSDACAQRLKRL